MATSDPSTGQLRSRLHRQEVVTELGQRALESTDLDRLLADVATAVRRTLDADYCSLLELLPDEEAVLRRAGDGWRDDRADSVTVPVDLHSLADRALDADDPIADADLEAVDRGSSPDVLCDRDVASGIAVTVGPAEEPWGVLGVYTTDRREFPDHDVEFVANVAAGVASAVDNHRERRVREAEDTDRKRIERELHETNRTLQRLYEITADRGLTFDEKVDRLLELGRDRLGLDAGFVADIDESTDRFEVLHSAGTDERLRPGTTTSLSETYCRRTIESDELLVLIDAPAEGWADDRAYETWDFDSYLGGQLHVDGELYGTLCFADAEPRSRSFTPAERSFVELSTQWLSYELERQRHQRELEESERRYRTLVEHFPNGLVALFDGDLRYTLAGGQALETVDVSLDTLVGQTIHERYDGRTLETFESNFRAALEGERNSFEYRLHDREWLAYTLPVEDDRGDVFAGMVMVQEVTDRKETERQLRERERRLERFKEYTADVLDAIDDVFYVVDAEGTFQRWNETLCEVTGYSDAEIDSMSPLEFFPADDRARIADAIESVFETGHARVEADIVTRDGEAIPYEFVASALEDPAGEPVLTGIGRDITDRRESQRKLEALVSDLESSNERLEQFAYAASHDLQEPLRMVASYLTLVERRYAEELDGDAREFIDFAVGGATRMQQMIDGLLAYSRVDTQDDPFEAVDLEVVIDDVLTDLEVRIEETEAEVTVDPLPRVYGDPGQLRQVFQNLIDNAITYSGTEAPRISVFAENNGQEQEWVISVRDRGIGIDPEDADRIFQVFDRLHSIDEYDGTGIGLALCQRIVERHDGDIALDSTPGEGATFSVTLPAPPETDAATAPTAKPSNE